MDHRGTCEGQGSIRALWLVTQAETNWHAGHRLQGHDGRPRLTVEGYRSAHRCARILAREPVRAVVSSDLRRDVRTAAPVARAAGVIPVAWPDLRERSLGAAEGQATRHLPVDHSGVAEGRVVDADAAPPGGETIRQLYGRVTTLLDGILTAGTGDVVVVAHGSVVALSLAWLAGLGPDDMAWLPLDSGLVVRREVAVPFVGRATQHLPGATATVAP
jgi:2,3-bisphosphoglycerate-dependent phosphoglycerate mutase